MSKPGGHLARAAGAPAFTLVRVNIPSRFTSSSSRKSWAEISSGHCGGGSKVGEREERMREPCGQENHREMGMVEECGGPRWVWQTESSGMVKRKGDCTAINKESSVEARRTGFESQPCHFLTVWFWPSHFAALCLSFPICRMTITAFELRNVTSQYLCLTRGTITDLLNMANP